MKSHLRSILLLLAVLCTFSVLKAEGTKEVMPNSANGVALNIRGATLSGPYKNAAAQNRVRFLISNHNTENFYFNFRAYNRSSGTTQVAPWYRILNAAGVEIVAATQVTAAQQISTYAQAVAGPNIGGSVPAGYTPITFDPTANGEYYIEIYESTDAGASVAVTQTLLTLFDFTVATSTNIKYPGRVYSQGWSLITYVASTNVADQTVPLEGDFYGLTTDGLVSKIDFNAGFKPLAVVIYFNKYGVNSTGTDWVNDRRSVNTGTTAPNLPNGYFVFLNTPDVTQFPRLAMPATPTFTRLYGCPGNYYFAFKTTAPGDVAILLNLNGVAGYQSGTSDRYLFAYDVPAGSNVLSWNGLNGLNAAVTSGVSVEATLFQRSGRTNLPLFDAELNQNGFTITGIDPQASSPRIYWDDASLTSFGTTAADDNNTGAGIDNSIIGALSPTRAWNGPGSGLAVPAPSTGGGSTTFLYDDFGNARTLNTWFYPLELSSLNNISTPLCDGDGDGVSNTSDVDDDNDGITDIVESGGVNPDGDADSDGIPNYIDPTPGTGIPTFTDTNNDGINDAFDTDGDGIINARDLDSDNDGITDIVEAGGIDTNGDGRIDGTFADSDGDGLANTYDATTGGVNIANLDTDGDGIKNVLDLDSDNDGIPDVVEAGGADTNNDGKLDATTDTDLDGLADAVDGDVGNDGTAENTAGALIITSTVGGTPGRPASYPRANADGNGLPNPYDLDSDGDGILDTRENVMVQDTNYDGVIKSGDTGWADANGDGWADNVDALNILAVVDVDKDTKPNYLDIDLDNDGIVDIIEAQLTTSYIAPSGTDTDGDGLDDAYDNVSTAGTFGGNLSNGITPVDTDGDGIRDIRDIDSDGDGKPDRLEGWDTNGNGIINGSEKAYVGTTDTDGDGLLDEYDAVSGITTVNNVTNNTTPAFYPDVNNPGGNRDWRQAQDWDKDGIADITDLDDDNDGIPDAVECPTCNTDPFQNGSFELPAYGDVAYHLTTAVPGWATTATDNYIELWTNSYLGVAPYQGTQIAEINATQNATLYQNFCLNGNGATILWRVRHRGRDGVDVANVGFGTSATSLTNVAVMSDGNTTWGSYNGVYTVPAGVTSLYMGLTAVSTATGDVAIGNLIDDIQITIVEQPCDNDGDGIPNRLDLDSDGDGIPDLVEAGGIDTDGNGTVDGFADSDGDGLANTYDATSGGVNIANLDTDGDGIPNYKDLDSDNDGIPDVLEAGGADTNNDGKLDATADTDNDGLADLVDGDVGNDGTAENTAGALIITSTVGSTAGRPASYPRANADGNGLPNPYDLDSDGDGILDSRESGLAGDTNNDGVIKSDDTGWADANGDGWADAIDALSSFTLRNTDGTGSPNYLDIDTDDDGIVDNIEGQTTAGYVAPSGSDTDGDGLDNAYDNISTAGTFGGNLNNGITLVDTDGDGLPDYRDRDSDNDGYPDAFEGHDTDGDNLPNANAATKNGVGGSTDADGDGLLDGYDNNTAAVNPTNGTTPTSYPNVDGGTSERDWREAANTDGDALSNVTDIDDDNDGIPDLSEYSGGIDPLGDADGDGVSNYLDATPGSGVPAFVDVNGDRINDAYDADLDGIINSLDLDSDNDGIADIVEAGGVDTNGDGKVDVSTDTDGDGLADKYDTSNGGVNIANLDTDGDGIPNTRDLDSDNDGIPDVVEAGGVDANNNGRIDSNTDANGDGWSDAVTGAANALIITGADGNNDGLPDSYVTANLDAKGFSNPYDLDSDGDGITDNKESGLPGDTDGNSIINSSDAGYADVNSDGWSDAIAALSSLNLPNTDGTGRPNYLDIDADDDGITDNVEGQTTSGYAAPSGSDTDGDGIDNQYDNFVGFGGNGIQPVNTDATDNPDYTDTDSDNDGLSDRIEGNDYNGNSKPDDVVTPLGVDTDGDGLDDRYETSVNNGPVVTIFGFSGIGAGGRSPAGKTGSGDRDWRNGLYVLPVTFVSITATWQSAGNALVKWTVTGEKQIVRYEVERSTNGTSYATVSTRTADGRTGQVKEYTYNDALREEGDVFYRIKQISDNGTYSYSGVAKLKQAAVVTSLALYPNPAAGSFILSFYSRAAQQATLMVTDAKGQIVRLEKVPVHKGTNHYNVTAIQGYATGVYVARLYMDGKWQQQRFTKM